MQKNRLILREQSERKITAAAFLPGIKPRKHIRLRDAPEIKRLLDHLGYLWR
jgi:hypothetical protein